MLLLASCGGPKERIAVTVSGMADDTLICSYITPGIIRQRGEMVNTLVGGQRSADGKSISFSVPLPDDGQIYKVFLAPKSYTGDGPHQNIELFVLPGDGLLRIDARYEDQHKVITYDVSGSALHESWGKASKELAPLEDRLAMTAMMIDYAPRAGMRDTLVQMVQSLGDTLQRVKAAYIGAHPDEQLSAWYLTTVGEPRAVDSLYKLLGDEVKNGPFKGWLDLQNEMIANVLASQKARADQQAGAQVPDLTLPAYDGGKFTLSSLYGGGKYIVLDFWGTWCSWCMKGMPEMKKAYDKHAARVEIVGIDCGDKEDVWRKSVKEQGLKWVNVRAEGDEIPARYGVESFPTKIILRPDGTIAARFNGEDPAFYTTLDSLVTRP